MNQRNYQQSRTNDRYVSRANLRYNNLNWSNTHKTSVDMGLLTPIFVKDVLPQMRLHIRNELDSKFLALVTPVMHQVQACIEWFYGTSRIIWGEDFENFIWGKTSVATPKFSALNMPVGSLGHRLGIPTNISYNMFLEAMPVNFYLKIYDDHYRHTLFANEQSVTLVPGDNPDIRAAATGSIRAVNWGRDPFTTALSVPQLGSEVQVPLLQNDVNVKVNLGQSSAAIIRKAVDDLVLASGTAFTTTAAGSLQVDGNNVYIDANTTASILANDMNLAAASINAFHRAEALHKWAERGMRGTGGSDRHVDYLEAYWGKSSDDLRFDRTHYMGYTVKTPVKFDDIRSNTDVLDSGDNVVQPSGYLSGYGRAVGGSREIRFTVPDYGYIMGILHYRPKAAYSQGVDRMWTRSDRFQYYWDDLAGIGETAVLKQEIYAGGTVGTNESTFGYQPPYYEYHFVKDQVSADMDDDSRMRQWHLGRNLTGATLNAAFIQCDVSKRIFADTSSGTDSIAVHVANHIRCVAPVAKLGQKLI